MSPPCVIVGAGGHAEVLIEAMRMQGEFEPACATDSAPSRIGRTVLDVPIVHSDEGARTLLAQGITHFAVGVGSTRCVELRRRLFHLYQDMGFEAATVIHPSSIISASASVTKGVTVFAGSIVNAHAQIGANVVLNTGSIIEHGCHVGAHAFLAPGVRVGGNVQVGDGAFLGIGATLIQGIRVGTGAVVGAGALVLRDIDPGETVVGVARRASNV